MTTTASTNVTVFSLVGTSPSDNGYVMGLGDNLTLTFNAATVKGTGTIVLYNAANTQIESFDVASSSLVTGWGTNTLTINPTANLTASTGYYLKIAATAIKDTAGNAYAGIADTTTLNFTSAAADGSVAATTYAGPTGSFFGYSVSSAGDVNSDGYGDFIVGSNVSTGGAYVVYGDSSGLGLSVVNGTIATSKGFVISGGNSLGCVVSGIGDVNGDGFDDVIVGTDSASPAAYVVYGSKTNTGLTLDASNNIPNPSSGFKITGKDNTRLGTSVSGAGDVNGDGLADFIIGAYANANSNGNAYVVYGKSGSSYAGLSLTNGAIATTDGFQIVGGLTAGLGVSVSGAGDVNGDGLSDVIVSGTDSTAYVVYGNATGTTVNAAPGALASSNSIGFRIGTLQNTSDFARIVSSAGDVNGDGLADVIVGSHYSNSAYVIYGNATGSPVSIDAAGGIPSSLGFQILSAKVMDFGNWVSSAGDVNGDGLADVIIGTNTDSVGAYVVYGNASGTFVSVNANGDIAASNGFRITGPASGIYGYRVSGAGDINGDGLADLLVGSNATGYSLVLGGTQWETAAVVGNGTVTGTASAEAVIGSEAADALTGGGGADRFYAGLGNDTIVLTASDVTNLANNTAGGPKALVNGGGGFDTIRMSGGAALDLTSIRNAGAMSLEENSRIESIERIDLATDTAANTLTLTAQDVKDMAGVNLIHTGTASADGNVWTNVTGTALSTSTGYHQMVVDGSALDTLNLMSVTGTWANAGTVSNGTCNYTVYQSAAVDTQVIVNAAVVVPMTLLGTQGADSLTGGAGADLIMGGTGYVRDGQFEYWPTYATGGNLSQGWATMTPTGGWTWASNAEVGVWVLNCIQ